MEKITRNAVQCLDCNNIIESTHRHDFKYCSCGNVAVDGGHEYLRRCYNNLSKIKELSEYTTIEPSLPINDDDFTN